MTPTTTYCTILAQNYLPKALSLGESLRRHHPERPLVVLLIDVATEDEVPDLPGVRMVSTEILGLSHRAVLDLAAGYGLVELATAVKAPLLRALLEETDQVVYLDPDTYVASPMVELDGELAASEGGIVLTPHYLDPLTDAAHATEAHLLTTGVYNLGFCAVDRRARPFLDWWWSHLEDQCLSDPLSGLFVDQKWVDIGSTLFHARALQHRGYNVGVCNIHERPLESDEDGLVVRGTDHRLRLFHFHAFDPERPEELSTRFDESTAHYRQANPVLDLLCKEYAEAIGRHAATLPPPPDYVYDTDTAGRRLSRHLRRAHRHAVQAGESPPSPFVPAEAAAFDAWRRRSRKQSLRNVVGDAAKALRLALPEEVARIQGRFPKLSARLRSRYVDGTGIWG